MSYLGFSIAYWTQFKTEGELGGVIMLGENIKQCEFEYTKCFCEYYKDKHIIRYTDNELKDMYYHNYTYIRDKMSDDEMKKLIESEISLALNKGEKFCNILLDCSIDDTMLKDSKYKGEVSRNGYYSFDITKILDMRAERECSIERVSNMEMVEDILYCDLQLDEATLGRDFCTRRCLRRGKVYISDKGVNSYICYHNGERIGNCDLFIHNGIAKIEDFAVTPQCQRKGYGTTILKHLIQIAINEGCNTIYLVTDEDDTAKEMYKKLGFNKVAERTDIFFRLN